MGAIGANDFLRQADESGQAGGDHASSRTDPDNAERLTGIYESEGSGFESLREPASERNLTIWEKLVRKSLIAAMHASRSSRSAAKFSRIH